MFPSESSAVIVIMLLSATSGIAGITQFVEPCAVPDPPLFVVQVTCTVPVPPEVVPLIEMGDAVVELGGAITASTSGLVGAGSGAGPTLELDATFAAYNSCTAAISFGIRPV
jgi:hypothetical protein